MVSFSFLLALVGLGYSEKVGRKGVVTPKISYKTRTQIRVRYNNKAEKK